MGSATMRNLGQRGRRLNVGVEPLAVKRLPTKDLLIATGERLFGQLGIGGVSLREIAAAAGQTNCSAVQYHFKDKAGLISAILYDRVGRLEFLRCELFRALGNRELKDSRELLKLQWMPTMSIRGSDGQHTFCRFLLQYLLQPQLAEHPGSLRGIRQTKARRDLVCLARAQRLLRAQYQNLSPATYRERQSILARMFLSAVVEHDNARLLRRGAKQTEFDLEPVLDMSIAALGAPQSRRA
jgi:AcrR family transcriptional regulator